MKICSSSFGMAHLSPKSARVLISGYEFLVIRMIGALVRGISSSQCYFVAFAFSCWYWNTSFQAVVLKIWKAASWRFNCQYAWLRFIIALSGSVSNGSHTLEQFSVRVGTGTEPLKQVLPHESPDLCNWVGFTTNNPAFQPHNFLSNSVFEFWSYPDMIITKIVQSLPLFDLLLSNLWSAQYSWSDYQNPANFAQNLPWLCSHSTNISRIVNLKAWGESAPVTAQNAYSSCHDTNRTQKLNCSQSCKNCKLGIAVTFQPSQKPTVSFPVRVTTMPRQSGSGFWKGLEMNRTVFPVQFRTAGGVPGPVAKTIFWQFRPCI